MNKNDLLLTSLVGAIPGLFLAVLMMIAFVSYAGGWSFYVKGLALMLLLTGGALAAVPVALFLADRKKPATAAKADGDLASTQPAKAVAVEEAEGASDDAFEFDESAAGEEPAAEAGSDDFNLGDDFEIEEDEKKK